MNTPQTTTLVLQLDAAATEYPILRSSALGAVHAKMLAAKVPAGHWLWTKLDDAYATTW